MIYHTTYTMIYNNNNFNTEANTGNYSLGENYKFTADKYRIRNKDLTAIQNNANLIKNVPKINIIRVNKK